MRALDDEMLIVAGTLCTTIFQAIAPALHWRSSSESKLLLCELAMRLGCSWAAYGAPRRWQRSKVCMYKHVSHLTC
jgi:hypothetical protein